MKVKQFDLDKQFNIIKKDLFKNIKNVLDHKQFILGPEVNLLEEKLSKLTEAKYCVGVSSGTDALLISLMALGVEKGDEIITTCFSFISTSEVITSLGAVPIFADIEKDSCNIDPTCIEKLINKRTKGIIAVSLFGQMANFKAINRIAKKNKIFVLEDAAQSLGARRDGKNSCNSSLISCTSFFPTKPLSCYGDGGAIFTSNKKLYEICKKIRSHGQYKKYYYSIQGVGGRLDTLQAAILLSKLDKFENENQLRIKKARYYIKIINNKNKLHKRNFNLCSYIALNNNFNIYSQFSIFIRNRDKVKKYLENKKIFCSIYYPLPLNKQKVYKKIKKTNTPNAIKISKNILHLPMGPYITKRQQDFVIKNLYDALIFYENL